MPSRALAEFLRAIEASRSLRLAAKDARLRPIKDQVRNDFLHAALASYVAGWDGYLNNVVTEFVQQTSNPLDIEYSSLHAGLEAFVKRSLKKFNTPNWENSRNMLVECTGYDPIGDWVWPRASMNGAATRIFLDEILRARHSFSHGFSLPAYSWTTTPKGKRQLNDGSLLRIERFVTHLVANTDKGLAGHARVNYPSRQVWY